MRAIVLLVALLLGSGCVSREALGSGVASWYGKELRGNPTASGERFRPARRTAAHRTLPFGTVLKVRDPTSGKTVRVVVNDRGPFVDGRVLDLSRKAARRLRMIDRGVSKVEITVVGCKDRRFARGCGN